METVQEQTITFLSFIYVLDGCNQVILGRFEDVCPSISKQVFSTYTMATLSERIFLVVIFKFLDSRGSELHKDDVRRVGTKKSKSIFSFMGSDSKGRSVQFAKYIKFEFILDNNGFLM